MKLRYFLPLVSLFLFFHSCSVTQQAYWGEELPVDCERNCILDKIEKAKISSSTPEERNESHFFDYIQKTCVLKALSWNGTFLLSVIALLIYFFRKSKGTTIAKQRLCLAGKTKKREVSWLWFPYFSVLFLLLLYWIIDVGRFYSNDRLKEVRAIEQGIAELNLGLTQKGEPTLDYSVCRTYHFALKDVLNWSLVSVISLTGIFVFTVIWTRKGRMDVKDIANNTQNAS